MDAELALPGNFLPGAVLTEVGLQLPEETTFEQWLEIGRRLGVAQRTIPWLIGRWWAFADQKWGERKAVVESEDWTGPCFQACMNRASVCKAFTTSRRREVLTFRHHTEVSALPPEQADALLDWCEEPLKSGAGKPRTIRALREEMASALYVLSKVLRAIFPKKIISRNRAECLCTSLRETAVRKITY